MRMGTEDYETLREHVWPYMKGTSERDRWDALWNVSGDGYSVQLQTLYSQGLHDDHIDTALRRIQAEKGQ